MLYNLVLLETGAFSGKFLIGRDELPVRHQFSTLPATPASMPARCRLP